jgi:hypothetical protein
MARTVLAVPGMAEKSPQKKLSAGRPKGPPKRSRVVRLRRDLDTALDIYGRVHKIPVSTIIEGLVEAWATANQEVIAKGRDLFEGVVSRRRKPPGPPSHRRR